MITNIEKRIKEFAFNNKISFKKHALIRIVERNISIEEIEGVLKDCKIIEEYPEDKPQKSYLILGFTTFSRPLHIVVAIDEIMDYLLIITAYQPNKNKWDESFSRRI